MNYEPAARSSLAAVHLAHLVTAFAQFNHDVQDPRSRRALRVVRTHVQPAPTHCATHALHFTAAKHQYARRSVCRMLASVS